MRSHPLDQLDKAARPPAQPYAENCDWGRPTRVDDELLRRPAGDLRAEVILDESQG